MPPKQRQIKIEQKGALAAAQAILGARAAERMDAKRSREHFKAAIAAARPQERLQLRRMAEASLALAERRAGDLKVAAEKLGQTPPSTRQLLALQLMGLIAPPPGSSIIRRIGGILLVAIVLGVMAVIGRRRQKRARERAAEQRADLLTGRRR